MSTRPRVAAEGVGLAVAATSCQAGIENGAMFVDVIETESLSGAELAGSARVFAQAATSEATRLPSDNYYSPRVRRSS